MNKQLRSEIRSKKMHILIAQKLKENNVLWSKPEKNLEKWIKNNVCINSYSEWIEVFKTLSKEEIIELISGNSEKSIKLRSSSPFSGILTPEERNSFFK
jgi:hypothetical protein